jgi:quercetin dioxygenase-like cupin family protein
MPLVAVAALPVKEIFPGVRARLVHTDKVSHSWVELDAGSTFPAHQHPHEQIVSVLEGELEIEVDGQFHRLVPGLVFVIPPHAVHQGRAVTACRVLDAFAPARDDYR